MLGRLAPLLLVAALGPGIPAWGQTFFAGAGRLHPVGSREATYSWQIGYSQALTDAWAVGFTWLNEGHLDDHHRDGAALQAWRSHRMEHNDLVVAAGLGPYRSFDTVPAGNVRGYRNQHGFGLLWSLRAAYPLGDPHLAAYLQLNRITGTRAPQTAAALVGLALRLDPAPAARARTAPDRPEDSRHELAFLFGRTVLNSFESETSHALEAYTVEYRYRACPHLDLSLAYADEGGIDSAKRDGLAATAWVAARPGRWLLAAGLGPYLYRMFPDTDGARSCESARVRSCLRYSMAAGLHLGGHWGARTQWHRALTHDHRDTDLLLAGLAYAW